MPIGPGFPLGGEPTWFDREMQVKQQQAQAALISARASSKNADFNYYASDTESERQQGLFRLLGLDKSGNPTGGGIFGNMRLTDPREQQLQDSLLSNLNLQRGLVNQLGESETNLINRDFGAAQGSALSRLEARGLGSSSLAGDTIAAVAESKKQSELRLQDQLLAQKLAVEQNNQAAIAAAKQAEIERAQRLKELEAKTFTGLAPNISAGSSSSSSSKSKRRGFGSGGGGQVFSSTGW